MPATLESLPEFETSLCQVLPPDTSQVLTNCPISWTSEFLPNEIPNSEHPALKEIRSFGSLQKGWDTYDAEPPSETACSNAEIVANQVITLDIDPNVEPTSDGSVAMEYTHNKVLYVWEFDFAGPVGVLKKFRGEKEIIEVTTKDEEELIQFFKEVSR